MKFKEENKNQQGQSLFEVMYAFVLIALVITAVVGLAIVSIRNSKYAKDNTQAQRYAEEAMEWLRRERDAGKWNRLYNKAGNGDPNLYCLPSMEIDYSTGWGDDTEEGACDPERDEDYIDNTNFLREISLLQKPLERKDRIEVQVTVSWTDAKGPHDVVLTTDFVRPE